MIWALGGDNPVIPRVTFLSEQALRIRALRFAKPRFRVRIPHWAGSCQAGFCLCTLRRSSVPPEPTFGPYRFCVGRVPPQPNCPPIGVPFSRKVSDTSPGRWCFRFASDWPGDQPSKAPTYTKYQGPYRSDRLQLSFWGLRDPLGVPGLFTGKRCSQGPSLGQ